MSNLKIKFEPRFLLPKGLAPKGWHKIRGWHFVVFIADQKFW